MEQRQRKLHRYMLEAIEEKTPPKKYLISSKMGIRVERVTGELIKAGYIKYEDVGDPPTRVLVITTEGVEYWRQLREPPKIAFTDLTKVMLQWRRFFRPLDLETRGFRRVLHPFAGAISALGFAIAVGAYLWKDIAAENAREAVLVEEKADVDYLILHRIDHANINAFKASEQTHVKSEGELELKVAEETAASEEERAFMLQRVAPKLGFPGESKKQLDEEAKEVSDYKQTVQHIVSSDWMPEDVKELFREGLSEKEKRLYSDVEYTYLNMFKEDEEQKKAMLNIVTGVTYFLYAAGLLVGILGQLVGLKPEGIDWEP